MFCRKNVAILSSKCTLVVFTLQVFFLSFGYVSLDPFYYNKHNSKGYSLNESYVAAYNPASQVCCSGSVFPKYPNSYKTCCASSEIDITKQVCCDGKTYYLKIGYHCCGGEYISVHEAKCCNSSVTGDASPLLFPPRVGTDAKAIRSMECCGSKLIDTRTHICCSQIKFDEAYYKQLRKEQRRISNDNFRYEHFHLFVRRLQFNIFEKKFKQAGCCKGKIYDKKRKTCPSEIDHQRDVNELRYRNRMISQRVRRYHFPPFDFCDKEIYDVRTHVCCTLVEKHTSHRDAETRVSKLVEAKTHRTVCCGLEPYDWDKQICCGNKRIHPQKAQQTLQCCGLSVFDTTTQICCQSSDAVEDIDKLLEDTDSCCGKFKLPFDSETQMCCGHKVFEIPKANASDGNRYLNRYHHRLTARFHCCWDEKSGRKPSIYDTRTETCCGGAKHAKSVSCCGSETMDSNEEMCCNGKKVKKEPQHECCGNRTFNSQLELCCGHELGLVLSRKSRGDLCCGNITYDRREQLCCQSDFSLPGSPSSERVSAVVFKSTDSLRCCNLTAIDSHTHDCCGGKAFDTSKQLCCEYFDERALSFSLMVIDKSANGSRCCGRDAYDPDTQHCCSGRVMKSANRSLHCCGSQLHDPAKQVCCEDRVFHVGRLTNGTCCGNKFVASQKHVCCSGVLKKIVDPNAENQCCYSDDVIAM